MMLLMISFFQEEEQLLELCRNKDAPVSEFTALLDEGVRLNIHDKVYIEHSTTIVLYSSN